MQHPGRRRPKEDDVMESERMKRCGVPPVIDLMKMMVMPPIVTHNTTITRCDAADKENDRSGVSSISTHDVAIASRISSDDAHHLNYNNDQSCPTCMYTGVATCTGLSLYFAKMAFMDLPQPGTTDFTKKIASQRRFLLAFGACWAMAGAYRYHLG